MKESSPTDNDAQEWHPHWASLSGNTLNTLSQDATAQQRRPTLASLVSNSSTVDVTRMPNGSVSRWDPTPPRDPPANGVHSTSRRKTLAKDESTDYKEYPQVRPDSKMRPEDDQRLSQSTTSPPEHVRPRLDPYPSRYRYHGQDDEQELTEIAAPSPVAQDDASGHWRKEEHLEDETNASGHSRKEDAQDDEQELTEIAAPSPVAQDDASGHWRKDEHLEDEKRSTEGTTTRQSLVPQPNKHLTRLYTISYLIFFSFWGTLARLGTQWIGFYPGAPVVISNLWANFGGCLLMGFISEDHNMFEEREASAHDDEDGKRNTRSARQRVPHPVVKKQIPFYVGLSVGFCGCFTSFSTFGRDMFFALANEVATPINHPGDTANRSSYEPRNAGYSVCALLAVIILTLCVNLAALQFGAHTAIFCGNFMPFVPYKFLRRFLDPLVAFLAFGCWVGAISLAILPPDRPDGPSAAGSTWASETWRGDVLFALVFAPIGCFTRFYLSLKLNARISSFPLGTFLANMFGVAILAMCYDIAHSKSSPMARTAIGGQIGCQVLQGIEDGFCGCLTTVSTWILELNTLKRRHAYKYGAASVVTAFCLVLVIMGSVKWSIGFSQMACSAEVS